MFLFFLSSHAIRIHMPTSTQNPTSQARFGHQVIKNQATSSVPSHMTLHPLPHPQFLSFLFASLPSATIILLASRSCILTALANGPSSTSTNAFFRSSSSLPGVRNTVRLDTAETLEMLLWPETLTCRAGSLFGMGLRGSAARWCVSVCVLVGSRSRGLERVLRSGPVGGCSSNAVVETWRGAYANFCCSRVMGDGVSGHSDSTCLWSSGEGDSRCEGRFDGVLDGCLCGDCERDFCGEEQ